MSKGFILQKKKFFWRGFRYRAQALARQKERQRDRKQEIAPQGGWPHCNPFSSILLSGSWACMHTRPA